MHVRAIEPRDISAVIDIATTAFIDDELLVWLAPKRYEYPASWRVYMTTPVRNSLVEPASWGYVCVPSVHAHDHDKIMGYALWHRGVGPEAAPSVRAAAGGNGDAALAAAAAMSKEEAARVTREAVTADPWSTNHKSWADAFNLALLKVEAKFDRWMRSNPAADYRAQAIFHGTEGPDAVTLGPLEAGVTHWHLGMLGVHPEFQRRGVGSALVQMGMEMARKESREKGFSIPVSLVASVNGNRMYKRLGFRTVAWSELPIEGGHIGGAAMVWDETGTWIENAEEERLVKGRKLDAVWTQRALDKYNNSKVKGV